jgi:hypothetical protein
VTSNAAARRLYSAWAALHFPGSRAPEPSCHYGLPLRHSGLRAKPDLLKQINSIPPVQSCSQKYFGFRLPQISNTSLPSRLLQKGRLAIVTNAGRDAVDADGAATNALEADGEVVWS